MVFCSFAGEDGIEYFLVCLLPLEMPIATSPWIICGLLEGNLVSVVLLYIYFIAFCRTLLLIGC